MGGGGRLGAKREEKMLFKNTARYLRLSRSTSKAVCQPDYFGLKAGVIGGGANDCIGVGEQRWLRRGA